MSTSEKQTDENRSGCRLLRDTRGAVLAEFVIVFIPLMTVFLSMVQYAKLGTANLVLRHSAVVGARAAAVVSNEHQNNPGDNGTNDDIKRAVKTSMGPWYYQGNLNVNDIKITDASTTQADNGPYGLVTVTVSASYKCDVPIGGLMCGLGRRHTFKEIRASFPHQGARYKI